MVLEMVGKEEESVGWDPLVKNAHGMPYSNLVGAHVFTRHTV
jgi:hypothetical protein